MRFAWGCFGFLFGVAFALLVMFVWNILNSRENLSLFPAPPSGAADVTITLSQKYVNDQMQAGLAAHDLAGTDIALELQPPNIAVATMTVSVQVLGRTLSVRPKAYLHFGVSNGSVKLTLDRVEVAGIGLPQRLVEQSVGGLRVYAEDEINASLSKEIANSGLRLIGVECTGDSLVMLLSRQPS